MFVLFSNKVNINDIVNLDDDDKSLEIRHFPEAKKFLEYTNLTDLDLIFESLWGDDTLVKIALELYNQMDKGNKPRQVQVITTHPISRRRIQEVVYLHDYEVHLSRWVRPLEE